MNAAHFHLLLNHLPIIGILFGVLLLLVALFRKSDELQRISFGIFGVIALSAIPVYLTGEPAEELVEHLPGVAHTIIERHETAALLALVAMSLTGLVSLVGLFFFRRADKLPSGIVVGTLFLALITSGLMGWTGNLGGQIRHSEIRGNTQTTQPENHDDH